MKALARINFYAILKAHLATLMDASKIERATTSSDLVVFYAAPLLLASVIGYNIVPNDTFINVLITSLSVFAGLLFNLLMLVLSVIEKRKGNKNFFTLQRETYANISYAIMISLIAIGVLLVPSLVSLDENVFNSDLVKYSRKALWIGIFFLIFNFGLTMAMILKRMHVIVVKLLEPDSSENNN